MTLDDNVLEQFAETGFDRALVAAIDINVVSDRALLADVAVGLHEHHPGGIAEVGAARRQLLQRGQPRFDGGQFLLARAHLAGAPLVFAARAGQLRFLPRAAA